jgi:phosphohistidine phosphatase
MNLYLLRHGIAGERGDPRYADDSLRPLVPEGRRKMRRIAAGMHALNLEFELWLTSPSLRARQTAEIVAAVYHAQPDLHWVAELAPEGSPRKLVHLLQQQHAAAENILLVGHEPYLGELMSLLLAGRTDLPLGLKKGGLCLLSVESLGAGPCARLEWLLTPRQLLALAP